MTNEIKELIAVGAAVATNCEACVAYHIGEAERHGASERDINAAVAVGKMVRKGAAGKVDGFVSSLLADAALEGTLLTDERGCGLVASCDE